jgi:riboflavin-specific deaminase-like protein
MKNELDSAASDAQWLDFLKSFLSPSEQPAGDLNLLFGPLKNSSGVTVVGQLGQSLDGRIATVTGQSKYINGQAGLKHLHRLRALADGVIIGVGTAIADDPMLTVRLVSGPQPARIVIDPSGKLSKNAKVWQQDGVRRIVMTRQDAQPDIPDDVEHLSFAVSDDAISPIDMIKALEKCGMRRLLVEGGADTISRFMDAGCLSRLHLIVAPVILGSGRQGINLAEIQELKSAIRPVVRSHPLDGEMLFDCDLSEQSIL